EDPQARRPPRRPAARRRRRPELRAHELGVLASVRPGNVPEPDDLRTALLLPPARHVPLQARAARHAHVSGRRLRPDRHRDRRSRKQRLPDASLHDPQSPGVELMRRLVTIVALPLLIAASAVFLVTRGHGHTPEPTTATTGRNPTRTVARPRPSGFAWPVYGFDPARRHAAPLQLRPPFRTIWTVRGDWSLIEFPPVLERGRLFLGTNHGLVLAVQARTGRIVWHRQFAGCVAASPAVGNGVVYLGFMDPPPCRGTAPSFLAALDARTGRTIWRFRVGVVETSPLLVGGRVYFG